MKKYFLFHLALWLVFFLFSIHLFSQNNLIQWQKSYGGSGFDGAYQVKQTSDDGYVVCGYSWSDDGDVTGHHGSGGWYPDGWVMKLKSNGDTLWTKSLGGTYEDYANSVIETDDGNFVVALQSQSNDGDVSVNKGSWDYWIVKLDSSGSILWEKSYGGTGSDYAYSVTQSSDGNYVVAGYSNSTGGDISGNKGGDDFWIIKVNETNGSIIWKKNYGGTGDDDAFSISKTFDNGFVVAGYTTSDDGNITVNQGWDDYWVIKLDSAGNLKWQKTMGGNYYDDANSIVQTADSGYIVTGSTYSTAGTGDVTVHKGGWDYWVVKINSNGTQIEWEKTFGGSMDDFAYSGIQTSDKGYMVSGFTNSNDSDITGNHGDNDMWTAKLDNNGIMQWSKTFGGDSLEYCFGMIQTIDGGYALAGLSRSFNEDLTSNKGKVDLWIVKTFCTPPYTPDICLVTVDSTSTKNLIVWEKPSLAGIDSFRVYRDVIGNYTYLGSVAYTDFSKFTDNTLGVNPQITSYQYKISSVDTCGNESPLSSFHKTIHLQINGANLTWDNYVGFNTSFYYRILRDTLGFGIFSVLDSVQNSNFTWTDLSPPVFATSTYVIEVVHPNGGCLVTKSSENHNSSRSNRGNSVPSAMAPVADFSANMVTISPGGSVSFNDLSTNNPSSWEWIFPGGNPSSSSLQNPSNIVYANSGCYNVTLISTNGAGTDTLIKTCYINVSAGNAPVSNFTSTLINISPGDSVDFYDLSQNNPTQWQWIFTNGNPAVSIIKDPKGIKYNSLGCFDVTLITTNGSGSDTKAKTCYISVNPLGENEPNISEQGFSIYPNPNDGEFEFQFQNLQLKDGKLEIFNVTGELVYLKSLLEINHQLMFNFSRGLYLIKIETEGKSFSRKLVVE